MANYWRFENISPHQFECFTHFQTWKPKWTTGFWLLPPVSATNGVMFDASQEDLCHELPGLLVDFRSRHRLDTSISARFGWYPMDETSNFFEMVSIYIYIYIYICIYIYMHIYIYIYTWHISGYTSVPSSYQMSPWFLGRFFSVRYRPLFLRPLPSIEMARSPEIIGGFASHGGIPSHWIVKMDGFTGGFHSHMGRTNG